MTIQQYIDTVAINTASKAAIENKELLWDIRKLVREVVDNGNTILVIATTRPLQQDGNGNFSEDPNLVFGGEEHIGGRFFAFKNIFIVNYNISASFMNTSRLIIHELGHLYELIYTGSGGHKTEFYEWYSPALRKFLNIDHTPPHSIISIK